MLKGTMHLAGRLVCELTGLAFFGDVLDGDRPVKEGAQLPALLSCSSFRLWWSERDRSKAEPYKGDGQPLLALSLRSWLCDAASIYRC